MTGFQYGKAGVCALAMVTTMGMWACSAPQQEAADPSAAQQAPAADPGGRLPVMISGTITDASGRTLSGQTAEAFYASIAHGRPLSVGLNCALGAKDLRPHVETLSRIVEGYVSAHPNAGLPNAFAEYDESPEEMAATLREFAASGLLNLVGGCCGTTPAHIRAIADAVQGIPPRRPASPAAAA